MSLFIDIKKKLGAFLLDVSLETTGCVSGLLGASGSGKSMTLMCVAGIAKPDSGKIILNGKTLFDSEKNINLTPQQRRIGYLFQNYALFPHMTVSQNILCGLHEEKSKQKKEAKLQDIIRLMQLEGLEKHLPGQLSGGQQQRVALGRILVGNPELLVLDEPFSALDSHLRDKLIVETRKLLKSFGKDALLVTHSRDEAYSLCTKIAMIDSGRMLAYKDAKALFSDPGSRHAATLTGCKNVMDAEKTGEYSVFVPEWNLSLNTSLPLRDGLCAIGIRAHGFSADITENRHPVRIIEEMEGPFEYNVQFRYSNQSEDSQNIFWLVSKEKKKGEIPEQLGVSPSSIMPLYS